MYQFNDLLSLAIEKHASDIHLSAGVRPCCRVNGEIQELLPDCLNANDMNFLVAEIVKGNLVKELKTMGQVDFARFHPEYGRVRVNVFQQRNTMAIVARILNTDIPSPESLGLPSEVVNMIHKRRGLILVTGATGVGKTTSLASLVNVINHTYAKHIITLEDPIEYLHPHAKSIVHQREIGTDAKDYASALKAALRQDPDVIMIGEMRDIETISTAITAAETGHLILSTLHTTGAASTIDRIIDVFPSYQQQQVRTQLADILEGVVSQQLIPRENGKGMVAAMEVLLANPAIRNTIREGKIYQINSILQTNRREGMMTMDEALCQLCEKHEISKETAMAYATDRNYIKSRLFG